jgi:hypothetical protein
LFVLAEGGLGEVMENKIRELVFVAFAEIFGILFLPPKRIVVELAVRRETNITMDDCHDRNLPSVGYSILYGIGKE